MMGDSFIGDTARRAIERQLHEILGVAHSLQGGAPVAGGSINRAFRASYGNRPLFIKLNAAIAAPMFAAEADGLRALRESRTVRAPEPLCHGRDPQSAWLVLEWIDLSPAGDQAGLGRRLAAMHRTLGNSYGWPSDNFIGATPQRNQRSDDWIDFMARHRIGCQVELASRASHDRSLPRLAGRLVESLPALFEDYRPVPSLLHGDLWGGNHGFARDDGAPVVFDPACYFGDRESDLAMMELFGGFDARVFEAYHESWPLHGGYARRRPLYQLYHVLNHFNLFGGAWLQRALSLFDTLLRETGA